jgi:hypothetical protein
MFIVSMLLFWSGLGTILFQSKSLPGADVSWLAGVLLVAASLPFLIMGMMNQKRIHSDSHHTLP